MKRLLGGFKAGFAFTMIANLMHLHETEATPEAVIDYFERSFFPELRASATEFELLRGLETIAKAHAFGLMKLELCAQLLRLLCMFTKGSNDAASNELTSFIRKHFVRGFCSPEQKPRVSEAFRELLEETMEFNSSEIAGELSSECQRAELYKKQAELYEAQMMALQEKLDRLKVSIEASLSIIEE